MMSVVQTIRSLKEYTMEVDVNNLILNMSGGLLPKDLQPDEIKALIKRYGNEWFEVLGYTEPDYTKPHN